MKQLLSKRSLFLLTAIVIGAFLLVYPGLDSQLASDEGSLKEIQSIETLRSQFNQDEGKIRLILLLSPT